MSRKTKTRKTSGNAQETAQASGDTRRDLLTRLSGWAIGGTVLLGGGSVFAMDFRKRMVEADLSVIGQGTPVVLQIHDPQCRMCAALQKETRDALCAFDGNEVLYRVANIRSTDGAEQQRKEGLPHVTLALYNGAGTRVHVVRGVTPSDVLKSAFQRYLRLDPIRDA